MLKKLGIAAAAVVVGLVVLKKTDLGSLMQVWWKDAMCCASRQVSPETRIKQLKMEIGKIDDDIKSAIKHLVQVESEQDKLTRTVTGLKGQQEQRAKDMQVLTVALKKDSKQVNFNDQSLAADSAQDTLRSLTAQYKTGKEDLKNNEERLGSLSEQVQLADEQIRKLKNKKDELLATASKLESDLARLRVKQLDTGVTVRDTQATKCEQLANMIDDSIQEQKKLAEKYARYGLTPAPAVKVQKNKEDVIKAAEEELAKDAAGKVAREQ